MSNIKNINWNRYSYTEKQLREAIATSTSIRQVLIKLDLSNKGAIYKIIYNVINVLNIDTKHFCRQRNKTKIAKIPLEKLMVENSTYSNGNLKLRLIKENIFLYYCSMCGINEWQGKKLSLHLDHINGINNDHRINNLRFLCPNCHSLTPTYGSKNIKKSKPRNKKLTD